MAIVRRKLRNGKICFWVKFVHNGKDVWERAGTNEREARALEARRKREVAAGTYQREHRGRILVASWFATWFEARTNRTVDNDRALIDRHVLSLDWFASLAVQDLRPKHLVRLVEEMRAAGRLGEKSISTVMGVVALAVSAAHLHELIAEAPTLPKGMLRRKTAAANKRKPYQRQEVRALLEHPEMRPDYRVFLALAFYTGMREGEICGRRWRDLDTSAAPLAALSVHSQYNDQPLKGDDRDLTRPRLVPVHPDLLETLHGWASTGFELVLCRKPTRDDFIVPQLDGTNHTKSSGYKMFQRALSVAGIPNRSLHSTRHTFISIARSCGARPDVLERVTHNAAGETIDDYTTFEWRSLCEEVAKFRTEPPGDSTVDPIGNRAFFTAPEPGLETGAEFVTPRKLTEGGRREAETGRGGFAGETTADDAKGDARHQLVGGRLDPFLLAASFAATQRRLSRAAATMRGRAS